MLTPTTTANQRNAFYHHPKSLVCIKLDNTNFQSQQKEGGSSHQYNPLQILHAPTKQVHITKSSQIRKKYKQMLEFWKFVKEQLSSKKMEFQTPTEYLDS